VLIDELGGGTDPEEGQALAKAIISRLLKNNSAGVITTHYTALKEYAFSEKGIENACMEFDSDTLRPLYVIKIGLPGSSNALAISRRLGLDNSILAEALKNLSQDAQKFENIVRSAEESRIRADEILLENNRLKAEWESKLRVLENERVKLQKEKDKFFAQAKAEARRIVNERTAEAEETLKEIEDIFAQNSISEADLIKARTLKNKLAGLVFAGNNEEESTSLELLPVTEKDLKVGVKVMIRSTKQEGVVQSVRPQKKEAEILCGNIRVRSKFSDLALLTFSKTTQTVKKEAVVLQKSLKPKPAPTLELNIIGLTVLDAVPEIEAFIDSAVLANLEEVRIVHGMGTGKLRKGVHEYLRTDKRVAEFRLGKYGEGDTGVTIVKLK
jgi:DNA mismatch repair protein MutS2